MANTLDNTKFTTSIDTLARQYDLLLVALGTGSEAETVSKGAAAILTDILDTENYTAVKALAEAAHNLSEDCKADSAESGRIKAVKTLLDGYVRALEKLEKEDGETSIDTSLTTRTLKAHPSFATLYYIVFSRHLSPANVFAPVVEMGRIDRGASTSTFTDGSAIPVVAANATPGYSLAQLEVYVPEGYTIGAADYVLTVTGKKANDTTETKEVTVPALSAAGTAVDVGLATDVYKDVTAITATGGTSGDRVAVRSKLLRSIAARCS